MIEIRVLVLVACLATGVTAFWFHPRNNVDFDGLDKYLTGELPNENEPSHNLALLNRNIEHFEEPLKRTADLVIKLAAIKRCQKDELDILVQINAHKSVKLGGQKRIEQVLSPYVSKATALCTKFIDEKVEEMRQYLPDSSVELILDFWAYSFWDNGHFLTYSDLSELTYFNGRQLSYLLKNIAKNDPEANLAATDEMTGRDEPSLAKRKSGATYALRKYVGEPCKPIFWNFNWLFAGSKAIVQLSNTAEKYAQARNSNFKRLIWAFNFCDVILSEYNHYERELLDDVASQI